MIKFHKIIKYNYVNNTYLIQFKQFNLPGSHSVASMQQKLIATDNLFVIRSWWV